jgi:hypothetical protein
MSDYMRNQTIDGSTIPITSNTTPDTAKVITTISTTADNIISQIKNNPVEYINNSINNEEMMRTQSKNQTDKTISDHLDNSADKLVITRDAVTSIQNNDNVLINNHILKSIIKSDLLNMASNNAQHKGDSLTAEQLQQASLSQSNVANALVQTHVLKSVAANIQNNGLVKDSSKILNIANNHLLASLNMIDYNHYMVLALDAFVHNNYDLSKQYEQKAHSFLLNNITLNDNLKGISGEDSKKLYAEVPPSSMPNNILVPPQSRCDTINAANISGWDDYEHAGV